MLWHDQSEHTGTNCHANVEIHKKEVGMMWCEQSKHDMHSLQWNQTKMWECQMLCQHENRHKWSECKHYDVNRVNLEIQLLVKLKKRNFQSHEGHTVEASKSWDKLLIKVGKISTAETANRFRVNKNFWR